MSEHSTPEELIKRYLEGRCSTEEKALLESWHLEDFGNSTEAPSVQEINEVHEQMRRIIIAHSQNSTRRLWPRIAAAASIILAITAGGYLFLNKPSAPGQSVAAKSEDLLPANNGVVLTIAGGKQLVLDDNHPGAVQTADGARANQSAKALKYEQSSAADPVKHTLTNNSGSKYNLTLSDGTQVALDAASSITYPVAFTGKERKVSVTGQVYLKVTHNAASPFRVAVADELIEDIGTAFNISAYADEAVRRVTLVEGAVKVSRKTQAVLLQPGEEVVATDEMMDRRPADLEKTLGWLRGKQIFNREPLENIMNQISRIYDVRLIWVDPEAKKMKFGGSFDRTRKLSTVLNFLRKVGPDIDFLVEGKTVRIFKKKNL
jgi:ferric-dicitrate binding protein FerR (iron transport regulator)